MEYKTMMELLIKEQFKTFSRLKKLQKNFNENPSVLKGDIAVRIEVLSNYYKKFCETNEKIENISSKHDIDITNEDYIKEDLAFKCELLFLEMKGKLLEDQSAEASVPKESTIPKKEDKSKQRKSSTTDLPKIDVPKFSGEFTDWLEFRGEYCDLVHCNATITNSQKFEYLKSVLPNEIFDWIKDLYEPGKKTTAYVVAWKVLEEKFSKRALVEAYLTKLMQQPSKKFSSENIDKLLHATEKCLKGLQSLNVDTKNWDVLLIYLLVQKLDDETKSEWNMTHSCHEIPKLNDFFKFLKSKLPDDKKSEEIKISSSGEHHYDFTCICCKQKHPLWQCDKFESLGIDERRILVRKNAACMRCLAENHTILDCWRSYTCRICQNRDHHYLLHKNARNTSIVE